MQNRCRFFVEADVNLHKIAVLSCWDIHEIIAQNFLARLNDIKIFLTIKWKFNV